MRARFALALLVLGCARDDSPLPALRGGRYLPAREVVSRYCAPCHTRAGASPRQREAYHELQLDRYDDLRRRQVVVENALALHGGRADMPPREAERQPTPAERALLLDWVRRGCPNTASGR